MSRTGTLLLPLTALAVAIVLTACSGTPGATPATTPTPEPTYAVTGDGVLRIGTIFPTSGDSAFLGPAQVAGVEVAVREINEAGGVNGTPVEVFHRNSGDATTQTAEAALADLVTKGVDVVIGPSSSQLVERLLAPALEANVPLISPAATSPALTGVDDSGFISRTIASYELQGAALAGALAEAKATKVAYLYSDDVLGTALLETLTVGIEEEGGSIAYSAAVGSDTAALITKTTKAKPDAVVLATTPESIEATKALITGLTAAGLGGAKLWLTSGNLADYSQALPAGALTGVNGVLEGAQPDDAFIARLKQADPALTSFRYAAEAYDAVILAALAVTLGEDDGGPAISRTLRSASGGGIKCTSFGECLDVLSTETDIDYDGISGPLDLTEAGDVASGSFGIFSYAASNTYGLVRTVVAG